METPLYPALISVKIFYKVNDRDCRTAVVLHLSVMTVNLLHDVLIVFGVHEETQPSISVCLIAS